MYLAYKEVAPTLVVKTVMILMRKKVTSPSSYHCTRWRQMTSQLIWLLWIHWVCQPPLLLHLLSLQLLLWWSPLKCQSLLSLWLQSPLKNLSLLESLQQVLLRQSFLKCPFLLLWQSPLKYLLRCQAWATGGSWGESGQQRASLKGAARASLRRVFDMEGECG